MCERLEDQLYRFFLDDFVDFFLDALFLDADFFALAISFVLVDVSQRVREYAFYCIKICALRSIDII